MKGCVSSPKQSTKQHEHQQVTATVFQNNSCQLDKEEYTLTNYDFDTREGSIKLQFISEGNKSLLFFLLDVKF